MVSRARESEKIERKSDRVRDRVKEMIQQERTRKSLLHCRGTLGKQGDKH